MVVPPIAPDDPRILAGSHNVRSVLARPNKWDDMATLAAWMRKRYPWKLWDKRILDVHLVCLQVRVVVVVSVSRTRCSQKHGFMVVDDGSSSYVTSRIPVTHEGELYERHDHVAAGEVVHEFCAQVPMHCVFGERPEMVYVFESSLSLPPPLTFSPGP